VRSVLRDNYVSRKHETFDHGRFHRPSQEIPATSIVTRIDRQT
jgi:hypothetical protein